LVSRPTAFAMLSARPWISCRSRSRLRPRLQRR
jgi:hypothetical protein